MAPAKDPGAKQPHQHQHQRAAAQAPLPDQGVKGRLKTSDEVFAFVRTDPRFDARLVHLVYLDKLRGCYKRCTVADWVPVNQGGDIPFHRVYFFEIKGQVFWDREARMYDQELLLQLASGTGLPPFKNLYQQQDGLPASLPPSFTVASLNVLFDIYEHRVTKLEPRLPRIAQALAALGADVIMLQECTPKVLAFLQQQEWVLARYALAHTDLEPYGQITLARCRIAPEGNTGACEEALTTQKKVLRVTLPLATGADPAAEPQDAGQLGQKLSVDFWNVHFPVPSNDSESRRRPLPGSAPVMTRSQQIERVQQLARARCSEGHASAALVGGDFNAHGVGPQEIGSFAARHGWRDAWLESCHDLGQRQGASPCDRVGQTDAGPGTTSTRLERDEQTPVSGSDDHGLDASVPLSTLTPCGGAGQGAGSSCKGYTYNPGTNALAQSLSRSQQAARFDRLLLLGNALKVQDMCVFGQTSVPPVSDHWGVRAAIAADAAIAATNDPSTAFVDPTEAGPSTGGGSEGAPGPSTDHQAGAPELTVKTALTWIPPPQDWASLQAIRSQHDPKHGRIMPHIHVVYPFVAPSSFAQFAARASQPGAFDGLPGLSQVDTSGDGPSSSSQGASVEGLVHAGSATVALQPGSRCCEVLQQLHVWACGLIGVQPPTRPYKPHLSLARVRAAPATSSGSAPQAVAGAAGPSASGVPRPNTLPDQQGGSSSGALGAPSVSAFSVTDNSAAARQYRSIARSAASLLPLAGAWRATRLCVISRDGEDSDTGGFVVKRIINLPGAPAVGPEEALAALRCGLPSMRFCAVGSHMLMPSSGQDITPKQPGQAQAIAATPLTAHSLGTGGVQIALHPEHMGGVSLPSSPLSAATAMPGSSTSDLDVLAACDLPKAEALSTLKGFLQTCGLFYNVYEVANEHMTFLRCWAAGGLELDVHTVQWPPAPQLRIRCSAAAPWEVKDTSELAAVVRVVPREQGVALSMVSEPRWLCSLFKEQGQEQSYRRCLAAVRTWAREAGVYGQPYGYAGGMVWAVLVAVALKRVLATQGQQSGRDDATPSDTREAQGQGEETQANKDLPAAQPGICMSDDGNQLDTVVAAVLRELFDTRYWCCPVVASSAPFFKLGSMAVEANAVAVTAGAETVAMAAETKAATMAAGADTAAVPVETNAAAMASEASAAAIAAGAEASTHNISTAIAPSAPEAGCQHVAPSWWMPDTEGGLAERCQALPDVRLVTLPDSNAAHRLLPCTVALTRVALRAGAEPGAAAKAVADAKRALPHRLALHLKAEDMDSARMSVCWMQRHMHRLLVFMQKECLAAAPDNDWRTACSLADGEGVELVWGVHYLRDCTRLHVVVAELQDKFHQQCKGVALWHEQH